MESALSPSLTYGALDSGNNPRLLPRLVERFDGEFMPRWNHEWGGKWILHNQKPGQNAVRLDGNDYLNLTGHPDVVAAQIEAMRRDTEFVVQSGAFLLDEHPSRIFERDMAAWVGHEDGFVCQSGYAANVGLIQSVADEQTPVYLDGMAHASLWEGARAANAPAHMFRHNDPENLERMIRRHGPGLVVVDSIYSTSGARCPLARMVEVAEASGCMILVDESHSLGMMGDKGSGLCAELGLSHRVHFITASLAKAFAGRAGFFTVPSALRYYVLHRSFPNIFSSCLLPHEIAGLAATLKVIQSSDRAREILQRHTRRLRASLTDMGYPIFQGTEQIIALESGTEIDTCRLRDELECGGVYGSIFCAPATRKNRALVRLTLNAGLTDSELSQVEEVAQRITDTVKPWTWGIAKRGRVASEVC